MTCKLLAYTVSSTEGWTIEPAPGKRDWMDATGEKFAYRCLPLVMANQAGWVVTCPLNFKAVWNGKSGLTDTTIQFQDGEGPNVGQIRSHFGSGIITFSMPWLFRTSPGYGLWVRGPTNAQLKDNIIPLDGIVETDWTPYMSTMNWKVECLATRRSSSRKATRSRCWMPFPLGLLEEVEPEVPLSLDSDPQLQERPSSTSRLASELATSRHSNGGG